MSGPSYDAIVVGAGPGGSTAATMMSESGLRVLLIDKDSFPRDKVCGDAISGKSMEALEKLGLVDQFETQKALPTWGLTISGPSGDQVEIPFTKDRHRRIPPGIVCQRERFDDILLNRAVRAGVIVIKGSVTKVLRKRDVVIGVATASGSETAHYFAPIVIGADGAYSIVARELGMEQLDDEHYSAGIRAYFSGVTGFNDGNYIEIHFVDESIPGYFWIFPLENGLSNVGVGILSSVIKKNNIRLKVMFQAMVSHPRFIERFSNATQLGPTKGWGLPLGSQPRSMAGNGWMLVGDAASLIDPFTGEGIGNAMISGILAAEWAQKAHEKQDFSAPFLGSYEKNVLELLDDELKISKTMQRLVKRKWLLNAVIRKASRSKEVSETITSMFFDLEARQKMASPWFYVKLLFA